MHLLIQIRYICYRPNVPNFTYRKVTLFTMLNVKESFNYAMLKSETLARQTDRQIDRRKVILYKLT